MCGVWCWEVVGSTKHARSNLKTKTTRNAQHRHQRRRMQEDKRQHMAKGKRRGTNIEATSGRTEKVWERNGQDTFLIQVQIQIVGSGEGWCLRWCGRREGRGEGLCVCVWKGVGEGEMREKEGGSGGGGADVMYDTCLCRYAPTHATNSGGRTPGSKLPEETPGRVPVYTALKSLPINQRTVPVELHRLHCDPCPST